MKIKQGRNEFLMRTNKWRRYCLELVHTYVCGTMQTITLRGASYFLIFIDDRTESAWVYLLGKMIQVDIGGHPPFPNGSKRLSGNFGNLLFLAVFLGPELPGPF
jgi:hypothetical protein